MKDQVMDNQAPPAEDIETTLGMAVVDRCGDYVGMVKDIRQGCYLVDRSHMYQPDLYVPFSACTLSARQLKLNIPRSDIDEQGWLTSQPEK